LTSRKQVTQREVMSAIRFVTLLVFLVLCASMSHAQENDLPEFDSPEVVLGQAVIQLDDEGRVTSSGVAIEKLAKLGFLPIKPDQRADYVDYRRVRKPFTFLGQSVIVIEEEYLDKFIGCCVNPGIGFVVETNGEMNEFNFFVEINKCQKEGPYTRAAYSLEMAGVKPKAGATYLGISCRQDDLRDDLQ
jgi:hypothetical protein